MIRIFPLVADTRRVRRSVWALSAAGVSLGLAVALGAATAPQADAGKASGVATTDALFVRTAARANHAEIELATLTSDHSENADVKALGDMLQHDHQQAYDELAKMASTRGVTIPDLTTTQKAAVTKLGALHGVAFDKAFLADMVTAHNTAISDFTKEGRSTKDADLKAFADKTLPVLKDHLQRSKDLQARIK